MKSRIYDFLPSMGGSQQISEPPPEPEDDDVYVIKCEPVSRIFDFSTIRTQYLNNSVMLPESLFEGELAFDENGYAEVYSVDDVEEIQNRDDVFPVESDPEILPVHELTNNHLKEGVDLEDGGSEDAHDVKGAVRTTILNRVYGDDYQPCLLVRPIDLDCEEGTVYPEYADDTSAAHNCYLHEDDLDEASFERGDVVEVRHNGNGHRLAATVRKFEDEWQLDEDASDPIGLDGYSRRLLGIEKGDMGETDGQESEGLDKPLSVHEAVHASTTEVRLRYKILSRLVGAKRIRLRVTPGSHRDEYNDIARVHSDAISILGIEKGDSIEIAWNHDCTKVRCLPYSEDQLSPAANDTESEEDDFREEDESADSNGDGEDESADSNGDGEDGSEELVADPHTISLPHTVRDAIGANIGDCIEVRRDVKHIFLKKMSVSLFSSFGIFIVALNGYSILKPMSVNSSILFGVSTLTALGFALAFVFFPERQGAGSAISLRKMLVSIVLSFGGLTILWYLYTNTQSMGEIHPILFGLLTVAILTFALLSVFLSGGFWRWLK